MIITEEELRQAWQNGRGQIPAYPPGTRFTPAALDFLKVREPGLIQACGATPGPAAGGERRELKAPPGQRLIFTAVEVGDLLAGGARTLIVHPSVTVTHAAQEQLRQAGVRVIPYVEPSGSAAAPVTAAPPLPQASAPVEDDLFRQARTAVLARLGRPVDPAVLDAVLRKVLSAL
jgi:hypothetical protein